MVVRDKKGGQNTLIATWWMTTMQVIIGFLKMVLGDLMQHKRNSTMLAPPVLGTSGRTFWDNMRELWRVIHLYLWQRYLKQEFSHYVLFLQKKNTNILSDTFKAGQSDFFTTGRDSWSPNNQQHVSGAAVFTLRHFFPASVSLYLPFNGSAFSTFLRDSHQLFESVSIFNDSTSPLFHVLWWGGQVGGTWQPVSWQLCVWKAGCCLWSRFQWMNLWSRVWDQNDSKRGVPGEKEKDAASRASFPESARRIMEMEILGWRVTAFH